MILLANKMIRASKYNRYIGTVINFSNHDSVFYCLLKNKIQLMPG